jgi:ribosomal peptide maturation radical SAM protein 1
VHASPSLPQGSDRSGPPACELRIVLLQMPWALPDSPSIALGILAEVCREADVHVSVFYPNLDVAAEIDFDLAYRIGKERRLYGVSEHLFAADLFGREELDSDHFLEWFARRIGPDHPFGDPALARSLRDEYIPGFLDRLVERVLAEEPDVVGLTATFNQVLSGLALAARLKARRPGLRIIAGGACYDDEMGQEYHRALPHLLDHVFPGEAEESMREFLRRLKAGEPVDGIPGVTCFAGGGVQLVPGGLLADLNRSPRPDYSAYFAERERIRRDTGQGFNVSYLPFESSRGCWWGQKSHCVFCGINRDLIRFRSKDVERIVGEIVELASQHQMTRLCATDWIIDWKSRAETLSRLREQGFDLDLFYEVRADLKKAEIRLMKEAGVKRLQPGIEAFSTPLLALMKKSAKGIRQIQFIRWCQELGVAIFYNVLAGFPGEQAQWYLDTARLIPRLHHLQPPAFNVTFVEMHRFSPLFTHREEFGVTSYELEANYRANFPPGTIDPLKCGYFFTFTAPDIADRREYLEELNGALSRWHAAFASAAPPLCRYELGPGFLRIVDTRTDPGRFITLQGLYKDIVLLCDEVQSRKSLARELAPLYPAEVGDGRLDRILEELVADDVLLVEDDYLLTLPIGSVPRTTEELRQHVFGASEERDRQVA